MSKTPVQLLGEAAILVGEYTTTAAKALANKKFVAFYFSAHWCGPCRQFTPRLATAYKNVKARDPNLLEVVFVSADQDEEQFNDYRKEMPWVSISPFAEEEVTQQLQAGFKVEGFPTLVVVDASTGKVVNDDAVQDAAGDAQGANAPWMKRTPGQILSDSIPITGKSHLGAATTLGDLRNAGATTVAVYFSAHWCPPCRQFTPHLAQVYKALVESGRKDFEFLFASRDREEGAFREYHETMGFPAITYGHGCVSELMGALGVRGIPTLVTFDLTTMEVVNTNARGAASAPDAVEAYPWKPQPPPAVMTFAPEEQLIDFLRAQKPFVVVDVVSLSASDAATCRSHVETFSKAFQTTPGDKAVFAVLAGQNKTREKDVCPSGCTLGLQQNHNVSCDGCGEGTSTAHSCRPHNFDLCDACFEKAVQVDSAERKLMKAVLSQAGSVELTTPASNTAKVYAFTLGKSCRTAEVSGPTVGAEVEASLKTLTA